MAKRRSSKKAPSGDGDMLAILRRAFGEVKIVPADVAAENMRRGNERYALGRLPEVIRQQREIARNASQPSAAHIAFFGKEACHDVQCTAKDLSFYLDKLSEHVARGEIGQAVLAGMNVGLYGERLVRIYFQFFAEQHNKRLAGKQTSDIERKNTSAKAKQIAVELYAEYTLADRKKLGKKAIYKEIGEIIQRRLKLPNPRSSESIRKYLAAQK